MSQPRWWNLIRLYRRWKFFRILYHTNPHMWAALKAVHANRKD